MSIEVQWDQLRVAVRGALRSPDPSNIDMGGKSLEELVAITSGEIVVTGAPRDAKLPRSVAGHVERPHASARPKPEEPDDDSDEEPDEAARKEHRPGDPTCVCDDCMSAWRKKAKAKKAKAGDESNPTHWRRTPTGTADDVAGQLAEMSANIAEGVRR